MIPLLSLQSPASTPTPLFLFTQSPPLSSSFSKSPLRRFLPPTKSPHSNNPFNSTSQQLGPQGPQNQLPPRTLFPGGYKRPEIKVPNLVLQLDPEEVLADDNALDFIDKAVSKWVGLVVLNGGEGSGGWVYEAARSLKAVVKDLAYFLIAERVDIAAAVDASGVVLSGQGLPAIVARNTMMDSKSDSVFLPLVARTVQTANAALNASSSEGVDFLIYDLGEEEHIEMALKSVYENVKIPVFIVNNNSLAVTSEASKILKSGASGLVLSLEDLKLFTDDVLSQLVNIISTTNNKPQDESIDELNMANIKHDSRQKMGMAGFIKVEDREQQLIEKERSVLIEATGDLFIKF